MWLRHEEEADMWRSIEDLEPDLRSAIFQHLVRGVEGIIILQTCRFTRVS